MNWSDLWMPYLVTHAITISLIVVCVVRPRIGKAAWGIIFVLAGLFNLVYGILKPEAYLGYGEHAVGLYQKFIYGAFSSHTSLFISLIAVGQILVGILLFTRGRPFLLGISGGILFLAAIAPLGVGSAFPSTLLMALGLIILYSRLRKVNGMDSETQVK
jgi:hypothetical protein